MTPHQAKTFVAEWVAAWNSHDLERILSHYSEDVRVTSPLIAAVLGAGIDSVQGKAALRVYWGTALKRYPELRFELHGSYAGVSSIVLHYRSIRELGGAEFMRFDADGLVCEVIAHYAAPEPPLVNESD